MKYSVKQTNLNFMNQSQFNSPPAQEIEESRLEKNIRIIESLDCRVGEKSDTILVLLGLKPATDFSLFVNDENPDSVKRKLKEAGLFFDDIAVPPFEDQKITAKLALAKEQHIASLVAFLFRDKKRNRKELGIYMGYPETAVEAFIGLREKMEDEEDEKISKKYNIPGQIMSFVFSKDNWQEEIKTLEKWVEALKLRAPEFYKKVMAMEEKGEYVRYTRFGTEGAVRSRYDS